MTDFLIFSRNNEISGVIESPGDMIGSIMGLLHGGHPMELFSQNLKTLHPVLAQDSWVGAYWTATPDATPEGR